MAMRNRVCNVASGGGSICIIAVSMKAGLPFQEGGGLNSSELQSSKNSSRQTQARIAKQSSAAISQRWDRLTWDSSAGDCGE